MNYFSEKTKFLSYQLREIIDLITPHDSFTTNISGPSLWDW